MRGLPCTGLIAQQLLAEQPEKHGYRQSDTPVFWSHITRPICFTLLVDYFGAKYGGNEHTNHLISILQEFYKLAEDWKGKKYAGLILDWDYAGRRVHLSMPGYAKEAFVAKPTMDKVKLFLDHAA